MLAAPSTPSRSDAPSHSDAPSAPSDPARRAEPVVTLHTQPHGPTLGTTSAPVIEVDGLLFKDLARTGRLLPYEDWRLPAAERAADLAGRLSIEQIAGLMLYSPHQAVPNPGVGPFPGTYDGGRTREEAGAPAWALTDQQRAMLSDDHLRHVLAITLQSADTAARWNNALQALAESEAPGVPVNISTDPRNGAGQASGAEFATAAVDVSRWPEGLGMAALFDPERVRECAAIISREYRALGITTALGPQIDLATDPRWMRLQDTWGPHRGLVSDYARAYCDAMQTTEPDGAQPGAAFGIRAGEPSAADPGWGSASVVTMVKHWPGGGTGEGGRDAHYGFGKFAVYPGRNEAEHLAPFTEAAFRLNGPTGCAGAVMPYYTISWGYRTPDGAVLNDGSDGAVPRANSYNRVIIDDMLRRRYGFDGVVCTDWGITADPDPQMSNFGQRCYGVEDLGVAERHRLAIDNGVDQFGGNSEAAPIIEAHRLIAERDGEAAARARFEASAARLLRAFFRAGLFENPYFDPAASTATVGCEPFAEAGRAAQRDSLVLLKNASGSDGAPALPLGGRAQRVWVPAQRIEERLGFMRLTEPAHDIDPFVPAACPYERAADPRDADAAVVFIESPLCESYSAADREAGGNGYLPIIHQPDLGPLHGRRRPRALHRRRGLPRAGPPGPLREGQAGAGRQRGRPGARGPGAPGHGGPARRRGRPHAQPGGPDRARAAGRRRRRRLRRVPGGRVGPRARRLRAQRAPAGEAAGLHGGRRAPLRGPALRLRALHRLRGAPLRLRLRPELGRGHRGRAHEAVHGAGRGLSRARGAHGGGPAPARRSTRYDPAFCTVRARRSVCFEAGVLYGPILAFCMIGR